MTKIERAARMKKKLAHEYGVYISAIVWVGGDNFVIVKDGKEIRTDIK